ncbi:hypothetical protein KUH03_40875 [Sphingobacterium sp. E70]|uniref:hypothetical protein n=1 Tax=Sphingobacterium sp. E70 TaxID=2853439 RepID=UPI00211C338E|nr:hypothetical protein [Sphingobacterium sp. E70]ULT25132.1 hypothetical protein KUH03_40875 [Sphingobacterium sp. E70]
MATDIGGTVDNPKQVFNGILKASYQLPWVAGLSVDGFLSVDKSANFSKNFSVPYVLNAYDPAKNTYEESIVGGNNNKATLTESHTNESLITSNIKLNFERSFGAHAINAFVGYEQSKRHLNILTRSVLIISPTSCLNYHKVDPLRQITLIQVIVLIIRDRVSLAG